MLSLTRRVGPVPRRGGLSFLAGVLVLTGVGAVVLAPAHTALAATGTATADVNLRAGPGEEYEALIVIPAGAGVSIDGDAVNGYVPVTYAGVSGWAAADLLAVDVEAAAAAPSSKEDGPILEEVVGAGATEPATEPVPAPATEPTTEPTTSADAAAPRRGGGDGYTEEEIIRIIHEAADRYGQPREDMVRVARCESGLNPNAVDPAGLYFGLFQFVPSTFAGTPYGEYDIFDPWANAHAAAWMWSEGRRGEWVCQ